MFGLAAKWKRRRPDRLTRLARAIETIAERDRKHSEESARADQLRTRGATALHEICRRFVDALNEKLAAPAVELDPADYSAGNYHDGGHNLFQINLRGRLLQIEFTAADELYSTEDFHRPYVLQGAIRAFNQDLLDRNTVDEQTIFYCPKDGEAHWYYFDCRTHRTGQVTQDFLAAELARLI